MPDNNTPAPAAPTQGPMTTPDFGTVTGGYYENLGMLDLFQKPGLLPQIQQKVDKMNPVATMVNGSPVYETGSYSQQLSLRDMVQASTLFASAGQFTAPSKIADRYIGGIGSTGFIGGGDEEFNAERQSISSKWFNGVTKMLGT